MPSSPTSRGPRTAQRHRYATVVVSLVAAIAVFYAASGVSLPDTKSRTSPETALRDRYHRYPDRSRVAFTKETALLSSKWRRAFAPQPTLHYAPLINTQHGENGISPTEPTVALPSENSLRQESLSELVYSPPQGDDQSSMAHEWQSELPATTLNRKIDFVVTYVNGTAALSREGRVAADVRSRLTDWNELWFSFLSIWKFGRLCLTQQDRQRYHIQQPRCLRGRTYLVVANGNHVPFWLSGVKEDSAEMSTLTPFQQWLKTEVTVVFHSELDPCQDVAEAMSYRQRMSVGCHGVNVLPEDLELGLFNSNAIEALIPFYRPLRDMWIYFNNDQVLGRKLRLIGDVLQPDEENPLKLRRILHHYGARSHEDLQSLLRQWGQSYENRRTSTKPASDFFFFNEVHAVRMLQKHFKQQHPPRVGAIDGMGENGDLPTIYRFAHVPRFFEKWKMIAFLEQNPINHTVNGVRGRHIADLWVSLLYMHFMMIAPPDKPLTDKEGKMLPHLDGHVLLDVANSDLHSFWRFSDTKFLKRLIDSFADDSRGYVSKPRLWVTLNDEVGTVGDVESTEPPYAKPQRLVEMEEAQRPPEGWDEEGRWRGRRSSPEVAARSHANKMPTVNDLFPDNALLPMSCEEIRTALEKAMADRTGRSRRGIAMTTWKMLLQVQMLLCNVVAAGVRK